jgi:hypothetical protein
VGTSHRNGGGRGGAQRQLRDRPGEHGRRAERDPDSPAVRGRGGESVLSAFSDAGYHVAPGYAIPVGIGQHGAFQNASGVVCAHGCPYPCAHCCAYAFCVAPAHSFAVTHINPTTYAVAYATFSDSLADAFPLAFPDADTDPA